MYEELLTDIGLTKSEISVYFALLEIGSSTTGPIIKKARIASGKAYLILDKLIEKGLTTYIIKENVKHYQATDPERLINYIKEKEDLLKKKEEEVKKIIPILKSKYKEQKYTSKAEIFGGIRGFRTFYDFILNELKEGDSINVMGVSQKAIDKLESYLIKWNKLRISKGIKMRIIYNNDAKKTGSSREKMKLTEVRYMKKGLETPAWIDIFNDYVVTIDTHNDPICFLIKNKESADSYRKYFDILWKTAKP